MSLEGKTAIVTGSTWGIGLRIIRGLAESGADVILDSVTDTAQDYALAEGIAKEFKVSARYVSVDMLDGQACRGLIADVGRCDILVNNAGVKHVSLIDQFPASKWDYILAINLTSAFHTTAAALQMVRAEGLGRVVNIASAHGLTASPFKSAYVAAKRGWFDRNRRVGGSRRTHHRKRHLSRVSIDPFARGAIARNPRKIRHRP